MRFKPYTENTIRKFGGENYRYAGFRVGKRDAQKAAKAMRAKGKKVRVVGPIKTKDFKAAYTLWTRG
jgi:hypothetical protein